MRHVRMFTTNKPSAKMPQNGRGMANHRIDCIEVHSSKMQRYGPGALRQAIDMARQGGGIVTFDDHLKGVIKLMSSLSIGQDLIIRGPGVGNLSIIGDGEFNVVHVEQWASVTISGLAFKGTNQIQKGAGIIINDGTLTLTNITV